MKGIVGPSEVKTRKYVLALNLQEETISVVRIVVDTLVTAKIVRTWGITIDVDLETDRPQAGIISR